jgi:hypothetical protein
MSAHSIRRRTITVATALAVLLLAALPTTAQSRPARFHAYVGGVATGPGHDFIVGNGLNLVFVDTYRSNTDYRVCWTRGQGRRCWSRTTGRRKRRSVIFTAAPQSVGTYTTTWYVDGRAVARWTFTNGPGD